MKILCRFEIKDPIVVSLNKYRVAHWATQKKIKDDQYTQIRKAIRDSRNRSESLNCKKHIEYPLSFQFILEKSHPFDCDNVVVKHWLDSFIKLKIIKDDTPEFVESVQLISRTAKETKLTINIYTNKD